MDAVYREHEDVVIDRHVVFLNCSRHGFIQPKYFNTMRDPVARLVSRYYFRHTRGYSVCGC
jgi:hypothetical protein